MVGQTSDSDLNTTPASPSSASGSDDTDEDRENDSNNDSTKEDGEISPSSADSGDEENNREAEFDFDNPRKTCELPGILTTKANEHMTPAQASGILEMARADNSLCAGVHPIVYPDGGSIAIYNLHEICKRYGFKNFEEAQREARTDAYSYNDSTGAKHNKEYGITINHYKAKDYRTKNYNSEAPFDRWTYATDDKRYFMVHYIGCSNYVADGLPHGNAKTNRKYIRSCRSLIKEEMEKSKDFKPAKLLQKLRDKFTKEIRENGLDPRLANVKNPRGIAQIQDARKRVLNEARLSRDTYINCSELGLRLRFDDYRKNDIPRSFIPVLGLSETNLFCYFEHPALIEEMGRVVKDTGIVGKLFYDTKFNEGDYYLTLLSWEHPYFNRQIIIAGYIHDRKTHSKHVQFIQTFWERNKKILNGLRFVIITDGEFTFGNLWQWLKQIFCFRHLKEDVKRKLKKNSEKQVCLQLLEELQQEEDPESYDEKLIDSLKLIKNKKAKQIFEYYGKKMKERSSAWACKEAKLTERRMLDNRAESMNAYIDRLAPKDGDMEADLMLIFLFKILEDYRNRIQEGYYNCPSGFQLIDDYSQKAHGPPKEVVVS
uniref:MULE transposase domain-containing protein n=1 Tax=Panagrolaimus sp. ES5 TaxID=591445 RepID=A0AC34FYV9_9BILA